MYIEFLCEFYWSCYIEWMFLLFKVWNDNIESILDNNCFEYFDCDEFCSNIFVKYLIV